MATPVFELTGEAIGGIAPHLDHLLAAVSAAQPVPVKLGRKPGKKRTYPKTLKLEAFFDAASADPPPTKDWTAKAGSSLERVFLNNVLGCCVISGKGHALGIVTANDSDSGGIVIPSDDEIKSQYVGICGPGDNGCVIEDVLQVMKSKGFLAGGKYYKIDGYVPMDWTNKKLVQVVIGILGAPSIGFNIPQAWMNSAVWDVTNSPIVGGHDVTPVGYNEQGVQVASWGRIYTITWAAFLSTRYLDEMYAVLYQGWYNSDKLAPSGLNADALIADLDKIGSGGVPDIDPPPAVLSLKATPSTIQVGQSALFSATFPAGTTSGVLDFGDGSPTVTVTTRDSLHSYSDPGSYSATLKTAAGSTGASVSVTTAPPPPPPPPPAPVVLTGKTEPKTISVRSGIRTIDIPIPALNVTVTSDPMAALPAGKINPAVIADAIALVLAVMSKDPVAIANAIAKLLADLGKTTADAVVEQLDANGTV